MATLLRQRRPNRRPNRRPSPEQTESVRWSKEHWRERPAQLLRAVLRVLLGQVIFQIQRLHGAVVVELNRPGILINLQDLDFAQALTFAQNP